MKIYHGTGYTGDIKKFRKSKSGMLGSGLIYFTTDFKRAKYYATKEYGTGFVYEVDLDVKNPFVLPANEYPIDFVLTPNKAAQRKNANTNCCFWLKASDYNKHRRCGCNCIIYGDEIAVFDNDIITIIKKHEV